MMWTTLTHSHMLQILVYIISKLTISKTLQIFQSSKMYFLCGGISQEVHMQQGYYA